MKTKTPLLAAGAAAVLLAAAPLAGAQAPAAQPAASAAAAARLADGEVRKVDKEQGRITLKHGPIPSIDMPPMTMVFGVKDKAMLDQVKPGDKVKFDAVDDNGRLIVVQIAPAGAR